MHKKILILLFINCCCTLASQNYSTSSPTWLTSPYFRAGNDQVISSMTGNDSTPTYTFTFSSALSGIPNLAYGIKNYRGNDTLLNEKFQIRRVGLSTSTFTVSIQIHGYTNIFLFTVPYLAIDPEFPHHLNSFDNVPLNYSSGPLNNFSSDSSSLVSHTQYINYTQQSGNNKYNTFQNPLTSNKIVIYITSLFILGSGSSSSFFPIQLDISYQIINETFYKWTANVYQNATIQRLHFSQIVYNQDDVKSSQLYIIQYKEWIIDENGGYMEFQEAFVDNMIMALTDFHSINGRCGFQYNWNFVQNYTGAANATFGILLNPSQPINYDCGFNKARSILFYIKTWECPADYPFYNITSEICQNGCATYFYENTTLAICEPCHYSCQQCSAGDDIGACQQCEAGSHRVLVNGQCVCEDGYFDDGYSPFCRACSDVDSQCLNCSFFLNDAYDSTYYQSIFSYSNWSQTVLTTVFNCPTCKDNYFLNTSSNLCQTCNITYCLQCQSLIECSVCQPNTTKSSNGLCYLCQVENCISCSADNVCDQCFEGFSWLEGNGNNISNGSCVPCQESCDCDGWGRGNDGKCEAICGDELVRGNEECDDGNLIEEDGCDAMCRIESQLEPIFLAATHTNILSLIFFVMGFKIVGLQMLHPFQSFQLLLSAQNQTAYQISPNIHGYSDTQNYPFQIPSTPSHMLNIFNFMLLGLMGCFVLTFCLQVYAWLCQTNQNDKKNQHNQHPIRTRTHSTYSDQLVISEGSSVSDGNFAVHYGNRSGLSYKFSESPPSSVHQNQPIDQEEKQILSRGSVLFRQFFFNLLINCLLIFIYSLFTQAFTSSFGSLLNFQQIVICGSICVFLLGMTALLTVPNLKWGQNQLKFHQNRPLNYWMLSISERILTGIFLALYPQINIFSLYILLAIKIIILVIIAKSTYFYEKIQKVRHVIIHLLHFSLYLIFIGQNLVKQLQWTQREYFYFIYSAILGLIFLITVGFYMRQIWFKCSADYRTKKPENYENKKKTAIFDIKQIQSESANELISQKKNTKNLTQINDFYTNAEKADEIPVQRNNYSHFTTFRSKKNQQDQNLKISRKIRKPFQTHKRNPIQLEYKDKQQQIQTLQNLQNQSKENRPYNDQRQKKRVNFINQTEELQQKNNIKRSAVRPLTIAEVKKNVKFSSVSDDEQDRKPQQKFQRVGQKYNFVTMKRSQKGQQIERKKVRPKTYLRRDKMNIVDIHNEIE